MKILEPEIKKCAKLFTYKVLLMADSNHLPFNFSSKHHRLKSLALFRISKAVILEVVSLTHTAQAVLVATLPRKTEART